MACAGSEAVSLQASTLTMGGARAGAAISEDTVTPPANANEATPITAAASKVLEAGILACSTRVPRSDPTLKRAKPDPVQHGRCEPGFHAWAEAIRVASRRSPKGTVER